MSEQTVTLSTTSTTTTDETSSPTTTVVLEQEAEISPVAAEPADPSGNTASSAVTSNAANEVKLQQFYASHQQFVVGNCVSEAMGRGEELLTHSHALRVLVNTHFEVQRRHLQSVNSERRKTDGDKFVPAVAFSEPCVLWSVKGSSGRWSALRKLFTSKSAEDAALLDKRTRQISDDMAKNGVMGFVMLLESLEQTTMRVVARTMFVVKLGYLVSRVADAHATLDLKEAVEKLSLITEFSIITASPSIEDVHRRMGIIKAAEKAGINEVDLSFEPGKDTKQMVTAKHEKFMSDAALNECLRELTASAIGFQSFELNQHQTRLLHHVLVKYPAILETIEREIAADSKKPLVVSLLTRSAQLIDDTETSTVWCTTKQIEADMAQKEKQKVPTDRNRRILDCVATKKLKDCGADAIVLELIDKGRALAYGNTMHFINYFGDIVSMKNHILAERSIVAKQEAEARSRYEKMMQAKEAPSSGVAMDDDYMERAVGAIVAKKERTVAEINAEWTARREALDKEYRESLAAIEKQQQPPAVTAAATAAAAAVTATSTTALSALTLEEQMASAPSGAPAATAIAETVKEQ